MVTEVKLADLCTGETEERMEFFKRLNEQGLSSEEVTLASIGFNCGFAALSRIFMTAIDKGILELTVYDAEGNPYHVNKAK